MTSNPLLSLFSQLEANPWILALAISWVMLWKGLALWKAAGLRQKWWFIVLLLVNTFGILEIIYLFFVAKKYTVEIIEN